MRLGYNTNGFAHHRLEDAIELIAELGYDAVAITLDHHALNPFDRTLPARMAEVRAVLERTGLKAVIETGSRFLLDRRRKHQPTLISPEPWEREYRLEFLRRSVWIAGSLGCDVVSFWSGASVDAAPAEALWQRLTDGCRELADAAAEHGVRLAFEPEPGMFIDTMKRYAVLRERVNRPSFGLTIDVGHLHCQGEPIWESLRHWRDDLINVHLDDARAGVHEHLQFGEGEVDWPVVSRVLAEIGFDGVASVELSRHSHDAVEAAKRAIAFWRNSA